MEHTQNNKVRGMVMIFFANIMWASSFVVTKNVVGEIPPILMVAIRFIVSAILIGAIFWNKMKTISKKTILICISLGVSYALGIIFQTIGIEYSTAGKSAFVCSANCIFVPILEWIFLKSRPKLANAVAAITCMIGIGFIVIKDDFSIGIGELILLLATIFFSIELIIFSKSLKEHDEIQMTVGMMVVAGIVSTVLSLIFEDMPASINAEGVASLIYLAIGCTGIPLVLLGKSQKVLNASTVTVVLGTQSVFAAILSALILNEAFTVRSIIGCVLVFLSSIVLVVIKDKKTEGVSDVRAD